MYGKSTEDLIMVMEKNININIIDYVIIQIAEFRR